MRQSKKTVRSTSRTGKRAAAAARWGGFSWKRLLLILPLMGLLSLVWGIWEWRQSRAYAAQFELVAIEVNGLRLLTGEDVLAASGLEIGDNVLEVDLRAVANQLEAVPWVRRAVVVRKPPDRLVVELVERQRFAWVVLDQTYGIDDEGVLLPADRLANETLTEVDLPVISGITPAADSLYVGMELVDTAGVLDDVLTWWKQATDVDPEFCMGISQLEALSDEGIGLRLAGDGLEVRLPFDRVEERLRELKRMMPRIYREYPNPAYIDLRYSGQLVVGGKEKGTG